MSFTTVHERGGEFGRAALGQVFDQVAVGMAIADLDGTIVAANAALCRILGRDEHEVVGRHPHELVHPADVPDRGYLRDMLFGSASAFTVEQRVIRGDGETAWVSVTMTLIHDEHGRPAYLLGQACDISERMRADAALAHSEQSYRALFGAVVEAIAATGERRDPYTAGHQRRVAAIARATASELGLAVPTAVGIAVAATIHDILADIEFPWPVATMVLQHHERLDGSGYPNGLSGGEILLESQILAVADVVEALASHRPYRPGLGVRAALEAVEADPGRLYDREVVRACRSALTATPDPMASWAGRGAIARVLLE